MSNTDFLATDQLFALHDVIAQFVTDNELLVNSLERHAIIDSAVWAAANILVERRTL